eukprot:5206723-Pleurochrysis_carterae.AAC.1
MSTTTTTTAAAAVASAAAVATNSASSAMTTKTTITTTMTLHPNPSTPTTPRWPPPPSRLWQNLDIKASDVHSLDDALGAFFKSEALEGFTVKGQQARACTHTHAHTHTRTHALTHARTHSRTHARIHTRQERRRGYALPSSRALEPSCSLSLSRVYGAHGLPSFQICAGSPFFCHQRLPVRGGALPRAHALLPF